MASCPRLEIVDLGSALARPGWEEQDGRLASFGPVIFGWMGWDLAFSLFGADHGMWRHAFLVQRKLVHEALRDGLLCAGLPLSIGLNTKFWTPTFDVIAT